MPLWAVFLLQLVLAAAAFLAGPAAARWPKAAWTGVCVAGVGFSLLWPLMRVFPTAPIAWFGAPFVSMVELTGLFIPAALVLGIGAEHVPRKNDRRAIKLLAVACGLYFVKAGRWMVGGAVESLGPMTLEGEVCRQSTGYTCVAASMVTLVRARGIEASELEMARLAHVEVGGGATDSRAVWALERKLAGTGLAVEYRRLDAAGLIAAPKPCLVQLDWGFFVSHMVPVMSADAERVVIGDPLKGLREMPMGAFAREWKGMGIIVRGGLGEAAAKP